MDDCVDEALVLCEGLRLNGYEAVAVHTGAEALQRCAQGDIELILLDVGLPDLDGYEVCRRLKARPETADIPVVFVTARGSSTDVDHGYSLGAVNYIVKPYNLPFVMVLVDSALRTRSATGPLPTPLEDPVYTDGLTGLKNRRFLYERLHEETDKARRYGYPVSCILVEFEEPPDAEETERTLSLEDMMVE
ncbi:MAG TPA: response regulator, partial [Candidatus Hydrogenedentes bacterium]|nr:response regulator [Candidatus Hydrogenedentota bacterium]